MKRTYYIENATDYLKYYSNCIFFSLDKDSIYVTSDVFPSTDLPGKEEDEDGESIEYEFIVIEGNKYSLVSLENVSGNRPVPGILAKKYSLNNEFIGETIVHPPQLSFYKILGSYGISSEGHLGCIKFNNAGTHKKGMSREDYLISSNIRNKWWQVLTSKIEFPSTKELYDKIDALYDGEINYILLSNRYAIVNKGYYKYPTLQYLETIVGHLNSPTNIKIAVKGRVANHIGKLINERGRLSRNSSTTIRAKR